jgi:hypothetical protein
MTELVRGYLIAQTLEFVRSKSTSRLGEELESRLSQDFRSALATLAPAGWVPREYLVELLNLLAASAKSEAERAEFLSDCGRFLNERTQNEYSALLNGILTPALLAKKLPRFFQREHRGSARLELEGDAGPERARLCLVGVSGYAHVDELWRGYMAAAFRHVHPGDVEVAQKSSDADRGTVVYEVSWS